MGNRKLPKFDLLWLIVIFYALHSPNDAQIPDDRASLLSFKSKITSDPKRALQSWNSSNVSYCEWPFVTCDENKNRVTRLDISFMSLRGTISPALFNLTHLTTIDLTGNLLKGHIPAEIGSLTHLRVLGLESNRLTGKIPPEIGLLRRLTYLHLGSNKLVGEIPSSIICNDTSINFINLSDNLLSGEISFTNLCHLKRLRQLILWSNHFVGKVPQALSNFTKLQWLDLGSNRLTGELPADILKSLHRLKYIYFSYNSFTSHNGNDLNPFFQSLLNSSSTLKSLDFAGNYLTGELPSIVGNLTSLEDISFDSNLLYGSIPPQFSNLINLRFLNMSCNLFNGSIPSELSRMAKLERLYLSNNSLSGHIPSKLGYTPYLGLLDLSQNKLTGAIPDSFSNLVHLRSLVLYENELSGTIPPSLSKCVNLEILDLSHNKISGTIPSEVASLSSLKLYLNLSSNFLDGHIPLELSKMDMVLAIDLSSNNLSSIIPWQLKSCVALENLNLSRNVLEGKFPGSVGKLPYLKELDVSFNWLTGKIPVSLQESSTLKVMNFSYNEFDGNVSNKGSFSSLTANSFLGNKNLCGPITGLKKCHGKRTHLFLIAILLTLLITPIFCLAGYPFVCGSKLRRQVPVFLNCIYHNKSAKDDEDEMREAIKYYPRITRRQLIEATDGFSESNLIGAGRFGQVYKGSLRDNTKIAVKVLHFKPGTSEFPWSFKRECQVLRRIRHRNLIKILTTCSRPDFKAMVLPLMANGSLESHLYPPAGRNEAENNGLDLVQAVRICSDVAEGMSYLHHYAPVRVVHCDLKPSNILLDDDMTGLVTDFGIARLLRVGDGGGGDSMMSYESNDGFLCGSVGYIAPEYGMGSKASPQGDVYSFGVLLLEIVTGKRPTDVLFQEGSNMHAWVKSQHPNRLGPIIEEAIARWAEQAPHDRDIWCSTIGEMIEIGLMCTQDDPASRPSMLDVAHKISLLKQYLRRCSPAANLVIEQASMD